MGTPTSQNWSHINERIGQELKNYYQACTTDELPQQLREVLKSLDNESPQKDQS